MKFQTKDSGKREQFEETGAQRDTQEGKPRYDLIPTFALARVAELYARGAEKYEDRNWEKGVPFSRMLASLERHLHQWKQGQRDEDHLAAVVWNALGIMHFEEIGRDELNDMPGYAKEQRGKIYLHPNPSGIKVHVDHKPYVDDSVPNEDCACDHCEKARTIDR